MPSQARSAPSAAPRTARELCYAELIASMKEGIARYYAEMPERLGDERSIDAQAWSLRGLSRMLKILDRYAIETLANPAQDGRKGKAAS